MILALALFSAVFGLASPFFQKIFIDGLLGSEASLHSRIDWKWLQALTPLPAVFIAFVFTLLASGIALVAQYAGVREGLILQRHLGERLYKKMLSIRPDSMGSTTVGEVVALYATDVPGSTAIIDQAVPMGAAIFFPLVFAPLAVQWISGIPVLQTVVVMILIITINFVLGSRQARFFLRYKLLAADRTGIVNEWIQNIRLLRILGWTENFETKIRAKREEETKNRIAMVTNGQTMGSFGSSISFVINVVGVASLVFLSGRAVTPGELFALLWIFGVFLARPFRQIPWIFTFSLDSLTSIKRLESFLERPSNAGGVEEGIQPKSSGDALPVVVKGMNLEINGQRILRDIDFEVSPGEFVAVVGEVGSGKSLLVLSLVGETGAEFKQFAVGSSDLLKLDLNSRRKFFAFVPQEGFVMTATLRENIAFQYEVPGDWDEDIERSLTTSQFNLSNEQVRDGLETELGERGVNLSGGQRQRVSLARAHNFDRPVVLLDDCLSAVDVDTEKQLLRDLIDGAWRDKTRILVTHRLSVLSKVDRVFFMEGGRIVEQGSFAELMARSPRVQEFVASVMRNEAAEQKDGRRADGDAEQVS